MPHVIKFDSKICYKASQCTDLMDCHLAIANLEQWRDFVNSRGYQVPRRYYDRLNSLLKRQKKFFDADMNRINKTQKKFK